MIDINDTQNLNAIQNCTDWRSAVDALLQLWASDNRCYSSGEVASALRVHRPDLAFSVQGLGTYLREAHYNGTLPEYADDGAGNPTAPVQVPRTTVGRYPTRTPSGVGVMVYGPSVQAADTHDFEVFVPRPKQDGTMETLADAPAQATTLSPAPSFPQTVPVAGQAPTPKKGVVIAGAKVASVDIVAKVWPDGRLCIPRPALEAAVHLGGTPLRGGDPVFVHLNPTEVVITLVRENPTQKEYDISAEKGRVAFPSSDPSKPFVPGTVFRVLVDKGKLTIDLTAGKLPTVTTI
jgi:hypothetical protein